MERTSNLNELKNGAKFTWGDIITIHEIGEYAIIEHHPWKTKGFEMLVREASPASPEREFSCYINGESIRRGTDSLDSALATCIAYKRDGINSSAAHYFMKMISQDKEA